MKNTRVAAPLLIGLLIGIAGCTDAPDTDNAPAGAAGNAPADGERIAELTAQIEALERRKQRIEDSNDIKRLQRAYGYYVDQALWDEVVDLFADDGSIEIALDGVYIGKERIRQYLYALGGGKAGLAEGELNEHMQLMPVVTVAPDGMTAKARWESIIMAGQFGEDALWGQGPYENEYVKENGVWKIKKLHWFQMFMVPYEGGWARNTDATGGKFASEQLRPDAPPSIEYDVWPSTFLPPFHFANPATGE